MRLAAVVSLSALAGGIFTWHPSVSADATAPVPYPEGYRGWMHIKSTLVGPTHPRFAIIGGFQHIYANSEAVVGYRTREFPEGSIVVFDWLELRDSNGAFREGPRRQVDVMVKDSQRFASTGGWGFQRFVRDSRSEVAAAPTPEQCFACHQSRKKDGLILSVYEP